MGAGSLPGIVPWPFIVASQRMKGPLGHFSPTFFDKIPLPLFIYFYLLFFRERECEWGEDQRERERDLKQAICSAQSLMPGSIP